MAASAKDVRIAVGFIAHPKIVKLRRRLGADGVLSLVALWAWTAANKPSGSLASQSDEDLEISAGWIGAPGALVKELSDLHLLDGSEGDRSVHDWMDHNPWAFGAEDRSQRARQAALAKHGKSATRTEMACDSQEKPCDEHAECPDSVCPISTSISTSAARADSASASLPLPGIEQPPSAQVSNQAGERKQMFDSGIALLTKDGSALSTARSYLAKLAKDASDAVVLQAIQQAEREQPVDVKSFLAARCKPTNKPRKASDLTRDYQPPETGRALAALGVSDDV